MENNGVLTLGINNNDQNKFKYTVPNTQLITNSDPQYCNVIYTIVDMSGNAFIGD